MRGRRRTVASALADALASRRDARAACHDATIAVAFAEACGPRLALEASPRGRRRDGRLLVVVRGEEWAAQVLAAERILCDRVNARLGFSAVTGLEVRVAER
jgi:Dna[CI] antecedent, DciA